MHDSDLAAALIDYGLDGVPFPIPTSVLETYFARIAPGEAITRSSLERALEAHIGEFATAADAAKALTTQSLPRNVRHVIGGWPFMHLDWVAASRALEAEAEDADGSIIRVERHYFSR